MVVPVEEAERILRSAGVASVRTGLPLAPFTSFRVGGPAALFAEVQNEADLAAAATAIRETSLPWFVIGKGSNVLVSDAGFPGLVVRLGRGFRTATPAQGGLNAGGSMPLPALAGVALSQGLAGLEFGVAIPGSVGGAVRMNAGAHGHSMSEVLGTIELFSIREGAVMSLPAVDARFAYRHSELPEETVVVGAGFFLRPEPEDEIRRVMQVARAWRRATQPLAEANCGSVFTNPSGDHAARLVEASGSKGLSFGGAMVSDKHANFIVARPGATAEDVLRLIAMVRGRVSEAFGVELETEVRLVGDFGPPAA